MHTETTHCLSARGEIHDRMLDFTCLMDFGGLRIDDELNDAWALNCTDINGGGATIQVAIPRQDPGPFAYDEDDQNSTSVVIELNNASYSANSARTNTLSARIAGEVQTLSGGSAPVIVGTSEASWALSEAGVGCDPFACPEARIAVSFRTVFDF